MASEIILKSLTGVSDARKQELDLPVTVSPSGPFSCCINGDRCIYEMTGSVGGRGEGESKTALQGMGEEREKMGGTGWGLIDNERQNGKLASEERRAVAEV